MTSWAKRSTLGHSMWEESSCDFNIGDLSTIGPDIREGKVEDELIIALAEVGISSMTVKCCVSDDMPLDWTYDSHLMDKGELER